jgi:hypothetical protein
MSDITLCRIFFAAEPRERLIVIQSTQLVFLPNAKADILCINKAQHIFNSETSKSYVKEKDLYR